MNHAFNFSFSIFLQLFSQNMKKKLHPYKIVVFFFWREKSKRTFRILCAYMKNSANEREFFFRSRQRAVWENLPDGEMFLAHTHTSTTLRYWVTECGVRNSGWKWFFFCEKFSFLLFSLNLKLNAISSEQWADNDEQKIQFCRMECFKWQKKEFN